jgi:hypothetical protein
LNKIKLVVSDLDGTLLDGNHKLNNATIDTVKKIQQLGVKFVVATGRNYHSLDDIIKKLKLNEHNGYVIGSNGQQLYDFEKNKLSQLGKIIESDGYYIRQLCYKNKLNTIIFYDDNIYFNSNKILNILIKFNFILSKINKTVSDRGFENYINIKKNTEIPGDLNKICILSGNTKKINKLKEELSSKFEILCLNKYWYEIMPKGVNKGAMLDTIMLKENLQRDEVMVFGDGENDIEMLKRVDESYAMKNAMETVKKVANNIAETNSENGVVKILKENFNV